MTKRTKKQILEEWKAGQPERDRVTRMLEERIAYHKAKLEEERAAENPKLTPEEQERQDLLDRYKQKLQRQVEDEFIERMRAKEEAEQKRESA
jgi:hypothetical protein